MDVHMFIILCSCCPHSSIIHIYIWLADLKIKSIITALFASKIAYNKFYICYSSSFSTDIVKRFDQIRNIKIISINELEQGVEYKISAMAQVSTKFGQSIVLTLQTNSDQQVKVYLPRRFVSAFNEENISAVNQGQIGLLLTFLGVTNKKRI
jgi:hypothetical protein